MTVWDYLAHSLGWSALSFILGVAGAEAGWWTFTRERPSHRDDT